MPSRIWIPGGGGGADLDVVTAEASHVLAGKVIVDKDGNPLTGTMPDNTGTALEVATNGKTLIPKGYFDGTTYATNTQATMAGGTKTPTTSQQTIACNGKLMTSNIIIPAFALPTASELLSGYSYTIYGKTVTGTAQVYTQTGSSVDLTAMTALVGSWGTGTGTYSGYPISYGSSSTEARIARSNSAYNLSNYLYLKLTNKTGSSMQFRVGVSKNSDNTSVTWSSYITTRSGTVILDISSLSGMYYIYVDAIGGSSNL